MGYYKTLRINFVLNFDNFLLSALIQSNSQRVYQKKCVLKLQVELATSNYIVQLA